jgi:hypothetical protein
MYKLHMCKVSVVEPLCLEVSVVVGLKIFVFPFALCSEHT